MERRRQPPAGGAGFHRSFARGISDTGTVVGAAVTDDKDPNAGPYRSQPLRWIC